MDKISQAAAMLGKKGGESGTGDAKSRPHQILSEANKKAWEKRTGAFPDRLWRKAKILSDSECWMWLGCKVHRGYGMIKYGTKNVLAHRLAYFFTFGDSPEGKEICHRCDNPGCINPKHLFVGTHKQNMEDCVKKGRMKQGKLPTGEQHPNHILTELQIKEIRRLMSLGSLTQQEVASRYGICRQHVSAIMHCKQWKHI